VFGTDVLRHAEQQVRTIRDNLRVASLVKKVMQIQVGEN